MAFFAIASVAVALLCEWILGRSFPGSAAIPPLAGLTMAAWFLALPLSGRLWLGATAGFFIDSAASPPFGSAMLLFFFLACAAGVLKRALADRGSYLVKAVAFGILGALVFIAGPIASAAAGYLQTQGV